MALVSPRQVRRIATRKARKYGIDPRLFRRQIRQESGFRADAVSPAGARGPGQLMPATARGLGVNPDDPRQNLEGAARLMRQNLDRFGNAEDALRAYNAGPGAVRQSRGYAETNNYVRSILGGRGGGSGVTRPAAAAGPGRLTARLSTPDRVSLQRQTSFDAAGFERAQRMARVASFLAQSGKSNSVLFRSGLLSTTAPDPAQFTSSSLSSRVIPGREGSLSLVGAGAGSPNVATGEGQLGAAIRRAQRKLGVREVGTSNRGQRVDRWERSFGMVGQPWCGIFAGQVLRQAGVQGVNSRIASVAAIEQDARNGSGPFEGFTSPEHARKGDLLITSRGAHVAMVEKVDRNGRIHVIGGNQSGGVTRAIHNPGDVYGVARVRYRRK